MTKVQKPLVDETEKARLRMEEAIYKAKSILNNNENGYLQIVTTNLDLATMYSEKAGVPLPPEIKDLRKNAYTNLKRRALECAETCLKDKKYDTTFYYYEMAELFAEVAESDLSEILKQKKLAGQQIINQKLTDAEDHIKNKMYGSAQGVLDEIPNLARKTDNPVPKRVNLLKGKLERRLA